MILHTVNKSPHSNSSLQDCLRVCADNDSILLLEDGVYAGLKNSDFNTVMRAIRCYALAADISARGLDGKISEHISIVDDLGFVALTIEHSCVQSWY